MEAAQAPGPLERQGLTLANSRASSPAKRNSERRQRQKTDGGFKPDKNTTGREVS
jgi:hypothetical protein